jgi:L-seryl-tRNA(Ser) seleniumtransferase
MTQLRKHPLARALRVDKTTIAGLEATLLAYLRGQALDEIPVWRMIAAPQEQLHARAVRLAEQIGASATVTACASAVGGGSLPGETLPSYAVALASDGSDALARGLRLGDPAVVARIAAGRVLLDVRTVLEEQEGELVRVVLSVVR